MKLIAWCLLLSSVVALLFVVVGFQTDGNEALLAIGLVMTALIFASSLVLSFVRIVSSLARNHRP